MIDNKLKILVTSVRKLLRRAAYKNIKTILDKTHTVDIAHLLEELEDDERLVIFKMDMAPARRAEVLSYLNVDVQSKLLSQMEPSLVNSLVSLMPSDDAADLLSNLQEDLSKKILDSMSREEKEEVQDLMAYPEDSAGGIMSSDYLSVDQDLTVAETIQKIQEQDENVISFYIYITGEEGRLVGVLSLKQLLLSKPQAFLRDIMIRDIISVTTETNQVEVANIVEHYDFLAVPVVDNQFHLVGVITVDDVIDVIREEAQEDLLAMGQVSAGGDLSFFGHFRSRFPWLVFTFIGGILCVLIVEMFLPTAEKNGYWSLTAFLPLLLAMCSTAGNQAATVTVEAILSGRISPKDTFEHLLHEMGLGAVQGLLFAALAYGLSIILKNPSGLSTFIGVVLFSQMFVAMFIGTFIPLTLVKLDLDPTVSTVSIFSTISNVSSVFVLFAIAYRFFNPVGG